MKRAACFVGAALAALVAPCGCGRGEAPGAGALRRSLGEPTDGFPVWQERVVHVWTNRSRCDPAADLADCSGCAERDCYGPVQPLVWDHDLARAARFHSDNLVLGG